MFFSTWKNNLRLMFVITEQEKHPSQHSGLREKQRGCKCNKKGKGFVDGKNYNKKISLLIKQQKDSAPFFFYIIFSFFRFFLMILFPRRKLLMVI